MKLSYDVFVHHVVYQTLRAAGGDDQDRVNDYLDLLAVDPFRERDETARDEHGRAVHVKMLGRFALFYWVDHAEKEVRVVDLIVP
jgi:hypothetical protein